MKISLIENLSEQLSQLSGIGKKTALRLALEIIRKDEMYALNLAQAIIDVRHKLKKCSICGNLSENHQCKICSNENRHHHIICVVEDYPDVIAIENTNAFDGVYHILGGLISPIDGIGPAQLNIDNLIKRIQNTTVSEIIFALNATPEGESTAFYLSKKIKSVTNIKISTLAKGISAGEDINYIDELTLSRSILNRIELEV